MFLNFELNFFADDDDEEEEEEDDKEDLKDELEKLKVDATKDL